MRFTLILLLCASLAAVNADVVSGNFSDKVVVARSDTKEKNPCANCELGTPMPTTTRTPTTTWCWTTATLTPPPQTGVVVPAEPPHGSGASSRVWSTPLVQPTPESTMPVFNGASSLQKSLAGLIPGLAIAMALI
ncbi:hypothetical protein N7495_002107 [Penicillium taxi]|uniref:uncharacterized protein n=1 Tax=Penicillium taxi TaxID=168475 RepID=UPI002545560E|nr:uncharacterized protein N7495_002107 [Penicillium taxi]KAJ5901579.1 hypothetical protein N7495_002107 [Penicillium taxi]